MREVSDRVFIIAEAGVNHDGSLAKALRLVDAAAEAGADAVKFQTFAADRLAIVDAPKANYQIETTGRNETQYEMLRRLELSETDHRTLIERCRKRDIEFLSTPFDTQSLALLTGSLGLKRIKLGSGEITNGPLLLAAARSGRRLIVSTGMATLEEVRTALSVIAYGYRVNGPPLSLATMHAALDDPVSRAKMRDRVTLLHCTTEYPAPVSEVCLRAMDTLNCTFGLAVGYSDHTLGIAVPIAAAARGAAVIEKHFTLDRGAPGPDHRASLEPDELRAMVAAIRQVEAALGDGEKRPQPSEIANKTIARKSIVARRAIAAGEPLTAENLAVKRPAGGRSPMHWWELLGTRAGRPYAPDERIDA